MWKNARVNAARPYAVEVSGWDSTESFFVERCDLEWDEESSKLVALKRALGSNTLLLVRLRQEGAASPAHPVVYEAEFVGEMKNGLQQFRLNAVVPA